MGATCRHLNPLECAGGAMIDDLSKEGCQHTVLTGVSTAPKLNSTVNAAGHFEHSTDADGSPAGATLKKLDTQQEMTSRSCWTTHSSHSAHPPTARSATLLMMTALHWCALQVATLKAEHASTVTSLSDAHWSEVVATPTLRPLKPSWRRLLPQGPSNQQRPVGLAVRPGVQRSTSSRRR